MQDLIVGISMIGMYSAGALIIGTIAFVWTIASENEFKTKK